MLVSSLTLHSAENTNINKVTSDKVLTETDISPGGDEQHHPAGPGDCERDVGEVWGDVVQPQHLDVGVSVM